MSDTSSLADALAVVQGQLTAVGKDKKAQVKSDKANYTYTYADLASVQAAVFPLLSAAGLAWMARPTWDAEGRFVLAYSLLHGPSGEREDGAYPLPDPTRGTPQQAGSAITYAKRYCLSAIVGVATDDDDGKAASEAAAPKASARPPRSPLQEAKAGLWEYAQSIGYTEASKLAETYAGWASGAALADAEPSDIAAFQEFLQGEATT
jgi:hypothetical protein